MGSWVAIIVIAVIAVAGVAALAFRRRRSAAALTAAESSTTRRSAAAPAAPMTYLEAALAQVTDRDGRPIRERIDAESVHVVPLRDPDDTGPLLRRALDSVVQHDDGPAGEDPDPRPTDA